jgi:hypothetical protein
MQGCEVGRLSMENLQVYLLGLTYSSCAMQVLRVLKLCDCVAHVWPDIANHDLLFIAEIVALLYILHLFAHLFD